jgi:predicted transcriptional regulator of viral defense system
MYINNDMLDNDSKLQRLRTLVQSTIVIRASDLAPLGIPQKYLRILCEEGMLTKLDRGVYASASGLEAENATLAHVAKAVPKSVVCLLSALRFHGLGTQLPHKPWIALDRRAAMPRLKHFKIRIVRFSGAALTEGIESHTVAGVEVRVYSPAKTIADCFKYRNKIGLEPALEALKDGIRLRRATVDDLWMYAKICRVAKIMQPYMEAIL